MLANFAKKIFCSKKSELNYLKMLISFLWGFHKFELFINFGQNKRYGNF